MYYFNINLQNNAFLNKKENFMFNTLKGSNELIDFNNKINFTLVDPRSTEGDLEKLCDIAYKHSYGSVCVNSCNIPYVKGYICKNFDSEIKVSSVIGFPLGAVSSDLKVLEIKEVLSNGADEIEIVLNIGKVKQGRFDYIKSELKRVRKVAKKSIVKVIIETCYLDKNEIVKVSKICAQCKIDIIKTSTGFGIGGAKLDDVRLIYDTIKGCCGIEVSGGVNTREKAIEFFNHGVKKVGTSYII